MIALHIQLLSKIEMPVREARDYIDRYFLASAGFLTTYNQEEGTVQVYLNQEELSKGQRHWLSTETFAAVYIDDYTVEKLPVIPIAWGVSEDGVPEDEEQKQHYRTWLPLTLVFDQDDVDSQEEADRYIVSLSFEIAGVLHREFDSKGLRQVRVSNIESEER